MEIVAAGFTVPKAARNKHAHLCICPVCEQGFDLCRQYREHYVTQHLACR
jgi:hypothetical protein